MLALIFVFFRIIFAEQLIRIQVELAERAEISVKTVGRPVN